MVLNQANENYSNTVFLLTVIPNCSHATVSTPLFISCINIHITIISGSLHLFQYTCCQVNVHNVKVLYVSLPISCYVQRLYRVYHLSYCRNIHQHPNSRNHHLTFCWLYYVLRMILY